MHVLHVIAPSRFGGAETVVRQLAAGRAQRGQPVTVACLVGDDHEHPFPAAVRSDNVNVVTIATPPRAYLEQARTLQGLCESAAPDVLHAHGYHSNFVGWLCARRTRLPIVSTVHGYAAGSFRNRTYEFLDRLLLRRFDRVISVSTAGARLLRRSGVPEQRLTVVRNGFVPGAIAGRETARLTLGEAGEHALVGWVGRFSAVKGPDLFVSAISKVEAGPWRAVMVGDGPERASVERLAHTLGVGGDRLRFLGQRSDAAQLMAAFDLLVLSSRSEGIPMVVWEAAAAGTPVAAFSVGGLPEVVSGESGWLVTPTNVDALAGAIRDALQDPAARRRKGERAKAGLASSGGMDAWLQQYEDLYRLVVRA